MVHLVLHTDGPGLSPELGDESVESPVGFGLAGPFSSVSSSIGRVAHAHAL